MAPALWGLRLGALLALDYAAAAQRPPAGLVLWQPVLSGHAFMTQFLRLKVAGGMLSGAEAVPAGTAALRAALAGGATLEVAGYDLHPALVQAIDALDAGQLQPRGAPVHWFDIAAEPGRPLAPASARIVEAWRGLGARVQLHQLAGPAFWATPEIAECPALVPATTASLTEVFNAG
jgi:exosortase A-associated hydrolase 2